MIRDETLQYKINRGATEKSALSSGRINKYEYITDKEILSSDQSIMMEQGKFTYSPLGKAFKKQTKTIEDQEGKPAKALQSLNTDQELK